VTVDKLIRKFLTDRSRITIEDCTQLLIAFGYEPRKSSGSHRTYHGKGLIPITIPEPKASKYVKIAYVKLVIKYLKLEG
jgi:predicted RNA binding protein YcfA (HicA-like mRNA interferase family)